MPGACQVHAPRTNDCAPNERLRPARGGARAAPGGPGPAGFLWPPGGAAQSEGYSARPDSGRALDAGGSAVRAGGLDLGLDAVAGEGQLDAGREVDLVAVGLQRLLVVAQDEVGVDVEDDVVLAGGFD